MLGGEGGANRRTCTIIDRHLAGVRVSEQGLTKESEARTPEGKTRTDHVGEGLSVSADIAKRASCSIKRERVGVVASKIANKTQVPVRIESDVHVAALQISDSVCHAHRRSQYIRITQEEFKLGRIAASSPGVRRGCWRGSSRCGFACRARWCHARIGSPTILIGCGYCLLCGSWLWGVVCPERARQ